MKEFYGAFSIFKCTLVLFVLSGCLPSNSKFKNSSSGLVEPSIDDNPTIEDDDDPPPPPPVVFSPSEETLETIDSMLTNSSLSKENNRITSQHINSQELMSRSQIDLNGITYTPTINAQDVKSEITVRFNHSELKAAVTDTLNALSVIASKSCSGTSSNSYCTFTSHPGFNLTAYANFLNNLEGISSSGSPVLSLVQTAEDRIRGDVQVRIQERNSAQARTLSEKNAAIASVNSAEAMHLYYSSEKNYLYSFNGYLSHERKGYTFKAYSVSCGPTGSVPVYQHSKVVNGVKRIRYDRNSLSGWSKGAVAFCAFPTYRDFKSLGLNSKTYPVYELNKSLTVDGKNVVVYKLYRDSLYGSFNQSLRDQIDKGWKNGGIRFWLP